MCGHQRKPQQRSNYCNACSDLATNVIVIIAGTIINHRSPRRGRRCARGTCPHMCPLGVKSPALCLVLPEAALHQKLSKTSCCCSLLFVVGDKMLLQTLASEGEHITTSSSVRRVRVPGIKYQVCICVHVVWITEDFVPLTNFSC